MKRKTLLGWGMGTALVASFIWFAQDDGSTDEEKGFVYLLDSRGNQSTPLEQALPFAKQMRDHFAVAVTTRPASAIALLSEPQQLLAEFQRTQDAKPPLPLFFVIDKPYAGTRERLRAEIDNQTALKGQERTQLLQRVVAVRGTDDLDQREGCKQLQDDIDYAKWNFRGLALVVGDDNIEPLKQCLQGIVQPE